MLLCTGTQIGSVPLGMLDTAKDLIPAHSAAKQEFQSPWGLSHQTSVRGKYTQPEANLSTHARIF